MGLHNIVEIWVLICYLYTDFHGGEKPKGGIEIFLLSGLTKGVGLEGGQEP